MKIPFSPPDIGQDEIEQVVEAMRSGWITTGPKTKELERQVAAFCHAPRAVCLNSATAALELTLHQLGIGPGDEVITSAYTYTASASVVCHVGAKLVLVDCQQDSYEMDYDALERAVTSKTKAIIPVDIGGVLCDYDRIFQIVQKKRSLFVPSDNPIQQALGRVAVVADSAHGFGASRHGKMSGEIADFTAFSFHAVKNFTTAEGGAVVWRTLDGIDNEEIYRQYMLLSLHGQSKDALAKTQLGAWEYDIVIPGYKCNMTDIMAGIGLAQMKRYPGLLARRREIITRYDKALEALPVTVLQHYGEDFASSGHLYLVRLNGKDEAYRNDLIVRMAELEVATNVHFKPLPMHTAYRNLGFSIEDYPNAYQMYHNEVTLPLHTCLTDEQVEYVLDSFIKVLGAGEARC
ncbi:MAG: DegT/DnrJ/EryC1/StrS family aminotransferase [Negativibacillus sp.]|nr:DegT/DnrJ/EryC1/StrS family aminotransferase [Negativibacillus sp.]